MIYTSIDNSKIKEIKKLQTKKYRDITNSFIIEGDHLVEEAYKKGLLKTIIVDENYKLNKNYDVDIMICGHKVMKYLSELNNPNKVLGICSKVNEDSIGKKVLALDNIQDPGNLGTIIRSAVSFNVDTILLSNNSVDLYNSKVIRATQGMIFYPNIIICDLKSKLKELNGYTIYGTKVDGGEDLRKISHDDNIVIVMGNEGNGVAKDILNLCDKYLYIKMSDRCESLNVAVATSIILYELDK